MGDDPGVAEAAAEAGAIHIGEPAKNEFGTPLLDWAFGQAARQGTGDWLCYVNADIILLPDFLAAVRQLPFKPLLGIGRRWDCDITEPVDFGRRRARSPPGPEAMAASTGAAAATSSSSPGAPISGFRPSLSGAPDGTTG